MPPASSASAFWDHWVPGANGPLEKLCQEWADKEKVELKVDFITSNGDKDLLTVAAEAQAQIRPRHPASFTPGTRRAMPRASNRSTT